MRFKRRLVYESGLRQIAVVPFVNIFFLLVVLVLLMSGFVGLPGVEVDFPRLITSQVLKKDTLRITVTAEGLFLIDGVSRTASQLRDFLSALPAARISLLVQLQKHAPAEALLQLWSLCQQAGITDLSVARTYE